MKMKYEKLDWDSNFFNTKVAIILNSNLLENDVIPILDELDNLGFSLIYWPTLKNTEVSKLMLKKYNGLLADRKVELVLKTKKIELTSLQIEEFSKTDNVDDLKKLALIAGQYSRFNKDYITKPYYPALYDLWIEKSINASKPSTVFVCNNNNSIDGFISLDISEDCGRITLLAVNENVQGKGVGSSLFKTAMSYCFKNGCQKMKVCTQLQNIKAMKFYEKCGFEIESIMNYYHFHLREK